MQVIYRKVPARRIPCIATIGVFDGVHLGHAVILRLLKEKSLAHDLNSLVITFDRLPETVLHARKLPTASSTGHNEYLATMDEKIDLFAKFDPDLAWFLHTTPRLLTQKPEAFVSYILRRFHVKEFIVGEDFCFGAEGKAGSSELMKLGKRSGFEVTTVKKKKINKTVVSSSLVRRLVVRSQFKQAQLYLGRPFSIQATVKRGKGLGRSIGFPTANLDVRDRLLPARGVYAAHVLFNNIRYKAALSIGTNPTVSQGRMVSVEAYLLDFKGELLGQKITIFFLKKIRDEKKFTAVSELIGQIKKDVIVVNRIARL